MSKPRHDKPLMSEANEVRVPPGAPAWVTPELIQHTLRVWQPYYKHALTTQDALGMILNTSRIVNALTDADRDGSSSESGLGDPFSS